MGRRLLRQALVAAAALAAAVGAPRALADGVETMGVGAPAIDAGDFRISGEVRYAVAGQPVVLFHYFALGPDCGPAAVAITLTEPPAHGEVRFVEGAEPAASGPRPLFAPPDPRARCAGNLSPTHDGVYTPADGFVGHDRLTVEFREGTDAFDDTIEVNVEKLAPERPPARPRRRGRRS